MSNTNSNTKEGQLDIFLFVVTFSLIAGAIIWGIVDNAHFLGTMGIIKNFLIDKFSWFIIIVINCFIIILFYLAFSKYGTRKLGKEDDKPEFSNFSWIALLFGCGIGAGYCFWPIAEPLWHYYHTPYLAASATPEAELAARGIALFNWGFHQWALFCIGGLVIAYPAFKLGKPMTVSVALYGILGDRVYTSFWGRLAELCGAFAALTGIAAALGLGLLLFNAGIEAVFGYKVGVIEQALIMLVVIGVYTGAALSGLHKGIKFLGDANAWICIAWFAFILLFGPTAHLLDGMVETWGFFFQYLPTMATFVDSTGQANNWHGDWSVFLVIWNTAWAPFVGGFIARISRGRTIREYIMGVLIVPVGVAAVWFGVLGTAAQYVELNKAPVEIVETAQTTENAAPNGESAEQEKSLWEKVQKTAAIGVYEVVEYFGGGTILKLIVFISVATFLITSADAAAFFVAMQMNRGTLNPSKVQMLIWSLLLGALAIILQSVGGLSGIQIAGVISGAPFIVIMCFMVYAFFKILKKEDQELEAAQKK